MEGGLGTEALKNGFVSGEMESELGRCVSWRDKGAMMPSAVGRVWT